MRTDKRLRWSTVGYVVLTLAVIGGLAFAATQLVHRGDRTPTAQRPEPTATATLQPLSTAVPLAPVAGPCGVAPQDMPTRDKLAQLLMVGVQGAADARAVVTTHHVGGIMVGSWTDLSMLTDGSLDGIKAAAGPLALAVSVDEEGGRVSRLKGLIGTAPSARALAASNTSEQVYQAAAQRGRAMRDLGITIDFAPVVDVTDAATDTVIGDRSFSADPAVVTEYAGAYARGLRDAGLLPVLKHFPGHGRASGDSHQTGVVTPPLAELEAVDLVPYRTLVGQGPVGVMVGHMQVPGLTGSQPASLSPAAYSLLRTGGYGAPPFGGPVFTDDLSGMRAVTDRFGVADAVLKSLQAGADQALWISTTQVPAVLDRLEAALAGGELSMGRVDEAVARMAAAKGTNPRCGG